MPHHFKTHLQEWKGWPIKQSCKVQSTTKPQSPTERFYDHEGGSGQLGQLGGVLIISGSKEPRK